MSAATRDPMTTLALVVDAARTADGHPDAFAREADRTHRLLAEHKTKPLIYAFIAGVEADNEDEVERLVAMLRAGFQSSSSFWAARSKGKS